VDGGDLRGEVVFGPLPLGAGIGGFEPLVVALPADIKDTADPLNARRRRGGWR
jgi:hypothetical protein